MKLYIIGAAALLMASAAHADSSHTTSGDATATATAFGGAGGAGGQGGSGGSVLGSGNSVATGGSATNVNTPITTVSPDIRTTISPTISPRIDTTDFNTNGQQQGQFQGQDAHNSQNQTTSSGVANSGNASQSQTATANNAGNSQNVGGQTANNTTNVDASQHQVRQVASAQAPIVVNVASCAIGGSMAGQGPGFGFALGGAKIDGACNVRANAQVLFQLGQTEAAVQYLSASDPAINKAVTLARSHH